MPASSASSARAQRPNQASLTRAYRAMLDELAGGTLYMKMRYRPARP
jgi:hypothetical protein